nr:MAG TPA: hypothetical protein [Caudoviricetes sp.]
MGRRDLCGGANGTGRVSGADQYRVPDAGRRVGGPVAAGAVGGQLRGRRGRAGADPLAGEGLRGGAGKYFCAGVYLRLRDGGRDVHPPPPLCP